MMKWILAILLLISATTFGQIGRGDDSTKYIRYQNQYGTRMPRSWWDSVAHMPYGDTALFPKPCRPGAIMMHTDKLFYKWNGSGWDGMGSGGGSSDTFGIQDNVSNVDRSVNMRRHNFTIDSIGLMRLRLRDTDYSSEIYATKDFIQNYIFNSTTGSSSEVSNDDSTIFLRAQGVTKPVIGSNGTDVNIQPWEIDIRSYNAATDTTTNLVVHVPKITSPTYVLAPDADTVKKVSIADLTTLVGGGAPSGPAGGDLTGTYPNPTIANNAVTNAKAAQMAAHTFKGNNTGSTANASDLTATQATAELNVFGASLKGLVPAAAASPSSSKYLSEDGTFSTPAGSITFTRTAYVDSAYGNDGTGQVDRVDKPFATINGALDALPASGGKIFIGLGGYTAPDTAKVKSNVWFCGSGMPRYDDVTTVSGVLNSSSTAVTRMIGGTRIHGMFLIPFNRNNVHVTDLGVDNGKAWCDANNGGTPIEGLLFAQKFGSGLNSADGFHLLQTSAKPRTGIVVKNVACLAYGPTSSVHCMIFENMINPHVENVYTCYGFAGVVIKSIGGLYMGIHAKGHNDAGIYVKSNDYSYCYNVTIDGFEITSQGTADGGGMHINANDGGSPGIYQCVVANGNISGTTYGIKSVGSIIDGFQIINVNTALTTGDAYNFPVLYYSILSNCTARACTGDGFHIGNPDGGASGPFISNCVSASNGGDGFDMSGIGRIELDNVFSQGNGGYGIRSTTSVLYAGFHTEVSNSTGATTGTINSKIVGPFTSYAGSSQYIFGPSSANQSSLYANTAASYLLRNGLYNGSSFVPSDITKQSELLELGASGFSFYNNHTGQNPMSPVQRFNIDSVGKLKVMPPPTGSISDSVLVWDHADSLVKKVAQSSIVGSSGTLDAQYIDANNTGTSATDLYSKTIAANQLSADGQSIHFEVAGVNNDATATVNIDMLFGGNSIGGTGAVTISATGVWSVKGMVIRTGSTTARAYSVVTIDNCTQKVFSTTTNITGLDFTTTNILKIRGTAGGGGGGSNDITAQMWKVIYQP